MKDDHVAISRPPQEHPSRQQGLRQSAPLPF
jgi:hypothetical protein